MKILIISPAVFALPVLGYGGVESLIFQYAKKLAERPDMQVTIAAPKYSYAPKCEIIETVDVRNPLDAWREDKAAKTYMKRLGEFDVIHDFSHRGIAGRLKQKLPQVKMIWHCYGQTSNVPKFPEPKYNLMCLSAWHAADIKQAYQQETRWLNMGVDTDVYKPSETHGDYYCYIGHPSVTKGMREAIQYCRKAGQQLHLIGGQVPAEGVQYRDQAMQMCDGKQIQWLGEVSNEKKRDELAGARAFLFPVQQDEGSSLAIMEALSCGIPVITSNKGAYPEMIGKEVGVCCKTEEEFLNVIANKATVESFDRAKIREYAVSNYSLNRMCDAYISLYSELASGVRWA